MGLFSTIGTVGGGVIGGFFGGPGGAAIGSKLGGGIGGQFDKSSDRNYAEDRQDAANDFNSAQAQLNRDFQERMSNTSYQRAVEDLRAAGLNPMLAYSNGGASVPVGGQASFPGAIGAADIGALAQSEAAAASTSSAQAASQQADTSANVGSVTVRKIGQEIENLITDQQRVRSVIDNLRIEYENLIKQGYNLTETGNQIAATVSKLRAEIPYIRSQQFNVEMQEKLNKSATELNQLDIDAARKLDNLGRSVRELKPFFDILSSIFRKR